MSAQAGGGIVLFYGPQGTAAQSGADVKLWPRSAPPTASAGRVRSAARGVWGAALHRIIPIEAPQAATDEMRVVADAPWTAGGKNEARVSSDWIENNTADAFRLSPWIRAGKRLPYEPLTRWGISTPADDRKHAPWPTKGEHIEAGPFALWALSLRGDDRKLGPWGRGSRLVLDFDAIHPPARRGDREQWIPWTRYSRILNPGWGVVVPPEDPPGVDNSTYTIPIRRTYIVVNEITLSRADDGTPIPAADLKIGFDCDSWLASFSATIHESSRDAVMPDTTPVEVVATVNGTPFRFFVERIQRTRNFNQRTVAISGRGVACELDAPYAAVTTHAPEIDRTAQQLVDDALVYTGYTQLWGLTDWLVPAGAFAMNGTPAQVAAAVANAAGAVLSAGWADRSLRMLPRYPHAPWAWADATPNIIVPADAVQSEGIEWIEKPDYNVVYVSGTTTGVIGQVKRTGTAGDRPAQMVTDPLITHADAARQRGTSILSDTGRKALMQISLPILPETGVIDLCKLVEFTEAGSTRRGLVRANQIDVSWPVVRQTLTIEAQA